MATKSPDTTDEQRVRADGRPRLRRRLASLDDLYRSSTYEA